MYANNAMSDLQFQKTVQALNYFARRQGNRIDRMKAMKLIWLSDRLHLREYARTITGDQYFAMKLGPVPSTALNIAKQDTDRIDEDRLAYAQKYLNRYYKKCISISEPDMDVFSETDLQVMNKIWDGYGKFTAEELSDMSHKFPEWATYSEFFRKNPKGGRRNINIETLFESADDGVGLFENNDDIEVVKDMYHLCS